MRKHRLENIVVTGKIEGERGRGRPRLNFMKSLSQLLKISEVEIIERTRNREESGPMLIGPSLACPVNGNRQAHAISFRTAESGF